MNNIFGTVVPAVITNNPISIPLGTNRINMIRYIKDIFNKPLLEYLKIREDISIYFDYNYCDYKHNVLMMTVCDDKGNYGIIINVPPIIKFYSDINFHNFILNIGFLISHEYRHIYQQENNYLNDWVDFSDTEYINNHDSYNYEIDADLFAEEFMKKIGEDLIINEFYNLVNLYIENQSISYIFDFYKFILYMRNNDYERLMNIIKVISPKLFDRFRFINFYPQYDENIHVTDDDITLYLYIPINSIYNTLCIDSSHNKPTVFDLYDSIYYIINEIITQYCISANIEYNVVYSKDIRDDSITHNIIQSLMNYFMHYLY